MLNSPPFFMPEGYVLTQRQKEILAHWEAPTASYSVMCRRCGKMYSAGMLSLCGDTFCGYDIDYGTHKHTLCPEADSILFDMLELRSPKITDEDLKNWYGFTRKELQMNKDELPDPLLNALKQHLSISLDTTGNYEGSYLEVKLCWDQEEITSSYVNLGSLR